MALPDMDRETAELLGLPYEEESELDEGTQEAGGLTDVAALRERLFKREEESAAEAAKQRQVLEQIQQAKLKLLEAPDRRQALMGLAQKLSAPRERDDPRFYERQNLYTFLRDVGEYGQEQKAAERKRQEDIAALQEKYATESLRSAEAGQTRAQQLAAQYLSKEPGVVGAARDTRTADERNAAAMGMTMKEYLDYKAGLGKTTTRKTAEEIKVGILNDAFTTLNDPNAPETDRQTAQLIIDRATPGDIRKTESGKEKQVVSYLASLKDQMTFTLPDLQSAIDQIDKGGNFAAGNLSRWLEGKPFIGQAATDLERTLESLRAKVGFDKMKELKELSAVGATGLGAVSNAEQRLLQSVKGSLERDQSPPNLRANLIRIKTFYEEQVPDLLAAAGISSIDEALKTPKNFLSISKPSSGEGKKKRTITLPSGRPVDVED